MTVLVDTSAFLAFLNRKDEFHGRAVALWQMLLNEEEHLVCNNYILVETVALLQKRIGLEAVRALQDDILPIVVISWLDEPAHREVMAALLAADRRQLSLVDCSAMVTMRALGIRRVFSFDPCFGQYGFNAL